MGSAASAKEGLEALRSASVESITSTLNDIDGKQRQRLLTALTQHEVALGSKTKNTEGILDDGEFMNSDSGESDEDCARAECVASKTVNEILPCDLRKSDLEFRRAENMARPTPQDNATSNDVVTDTATNMKTVTVEGAIFRVPASYEPVELLGSGAYGTVAQFSNASGQGVAVKKISGIFGDAADAAQAKLILREIALLRHFEHENVCQLVGLVPPSSPQFDDIYIVLGLMETDLHNIIQSDQEISDEVVQCFSYQILVGLKYLHSAKVVHRDMKPRNLLVNGDCQLKICDFGWARVLEDPTATIQDHKTPAKPSRRTSQFGRSLTTNVVTLWYRAPELVLSERYSLGVDIFSAGCVLAELVSRRALFKSASMREHITMIMCVLGVPSEDELKKFAMSGNSCQEISDAIKRIESRPDIANSWDAVGKRTQWSAVYPEVDQAKWLPELTIVLDRLLVFHPSTRASATEALELEYFSDWHDPKEEPVCDRDIDWSFELNEMTMVDVRNAIYNECIAQDVASNTDIISPVPSHKSLRRTSSVTTISDMPLPFPAFLTGQ